MLGESKQNIDMTSFSNTLGIPYNLKQLPNEMWISGSVVLSFFVCWAPHHIQRLVHVFVYTYK